MWLNEKKNLPYTCPAALHGRMWQVLFISMVCFAEAGAAAPNMTQILLCSWLILTLILLDGISQVICVSSNGPQEILITHFRVLVMLRLVHVFIYLISLVLVLVIRCCKMGQKVGVIYGRIHKLVSIFNLKLKAFMMVLKSFPLQHEGNINTSLRHFILKSIKSHVQIMINKNVLLK